eukprot:TRINITY_DN43152_c0_g1_i2.p1 TRINITY_DN43152_c0_g1~~TRINITY_DN43152_c0_g1_i2.p1  ORF type:complete len:395 (-),score=58.01 TRINITY_DN43152_c0_g1_i2:33-1217(-)
MCIRDRYMGNIPELGSWNPIDAVILTATTFSESNPIWETQNPLSLPTNVPIEYKFVKMTTGSIVWEELPNGMNHTLLLDQQQDLEIHHCFGEAGKEILRLERDRHSSPLEDSKTSTEKIKKSIIPEYRTGANAASEKEKTEPPITMTGEDVVIFVLHILPLVITKKEDKYEYTHSRRVLYPSLFRLSELNVVQIKWVGLITTQDYSSEEQEKIRTDLEKFGIYPVSIEKKILEDFTYYYDYVIFPLFHNFVSYRKNVDLSNAKYHQAYITVNQIFVETIVSIKKKIPKAMVLFNDPYFLLAPRILAKENLNNHIGYFFHSPFPSGEIFRVLPHVLCVDTLSLIHISEPTRPLYISYAVFCLKKKKKNTTRPTPSLCTYINNIIPTISKTSDIQV